MVEIISLPNKIFVMVICPLIMVEIIGLPNKIFLMGLIVFSKIIITSNHPYLSLFFN